MEEINLLEVFQYFRSKLVWILASILLVLIAGNSFYALTREPLYKSSTTIVLVNNSETTTLTQNDLLMNKNLVSTYSEIIKSRNVLGQVIKNLDLDVDYKTLSKSVSVSAVADTEIIKVDVGSENSKEARDIANEIAEVFTKEIKDIYNLENVRIVDKAIMAEEPYNLTYTKDNVIFLAIGLVVSCGVIFMVYYFDTTIKSTDAIEEKLGLSVIGVVPEEKGGK